MYGDFIRYLISLHDGFEKFESVKYVNPYEKHGIIDKDVNEGFLWPTKVKDVVYRISPIPAKCIHLGEIETVEKFNDEFDRQMPNGGRQVYKIKSVGKLTAKNLYYGHSCTNSTWLEDGAIINNKKFEWDYSDYNIIRQTDHQIIFIKLSPFSTYADHYLDRHDAWEKGMLGITHEGVSHNSDGSREKHLEVWKRNYINYEYPKHKLNYVLELEYLLDKDDETYYNLTKFLNVKPIDNWKQHIEKYKKSIKI